MGKVPQPFKIEFLNTCISVILYPDIKLLIVFQACEVFTDSEVFLKELTLNVKWWELLLATLYYLPFGLCNGK